MINGVKFVVSGGSANLTGALLSPEHGDVHPGLAMRPIGIWDFGDFATFGSATLTFHYDAFTAASNNVAEADLQVVRWDGSNWSVVTAPGGLDTVNRTITTRAFASGSPLTQFAIGRPAQGTMLLIQ